MLSRILKSVHGLLIVNEVGYLNVDRRAGGECRSFTMAALRHREEYLVFSAARPARPEMSHSATFNSSSCLVWCVTIHVMVILTNGLGSK